MVQSYSLAVGLLASILLSSMVLARPGPRPWPDEDANLRVVRDYCNSPSKKLIGLKDMGKKDQDLLLREHNKYREKVASGKEPPQPGAQSMILLTWSSDAALQAKAWASGCDFKHNSPKTKIKKNPMGQNIYMKISSENETLESTFKRYIPEMVKGWYDEVKLYNYGDSFSAATGHYTQIVWKRTTTVGCGYAYFEDGSNYNGYLVCNYSPAGNWAGQPPYEKGNGSCTGKLVASTDYPHLCYKPKKSSVKQPSTTTKLPVKRKPSDDGGLKKKGGKKK